VKIADHLKLYLAHAYSGNTPTGLLVRPSKTAYVYLTQDSQRRRTTPQRKASGVNEPLITVLPRGQLIVHSNGQLLMR